MQNNPVIGITVDYQEKVNSYSKYPWFALRRHYTQCLEIFDCAPVIIPIGKNNNYDFLDGLLISGGDFDIDPKFYGEEINNTVNDIHQMTPEDEQVAVLQKLTTEKQSILLSIAAVYENDFSATEIQTILSFYTSPLGQRWLALKDPLKESSNDIFTEWLTTLQDRL